MPAPLDLSEGELSAYAGRYATPDFAATLRVEGGQLLLSLDHPPVPDLIHPEIEAPSATDVPLSVISGERLAVGSFLVGAIVRRPDGAVGWLRLSILSLPRVGDGQPVPLLPAPHIHDEDPAASASAAGQRCGLRLRDVATFPILTPFHSQELGIDAMPRESSGAIPPRSRP